MKHAPLLLLACALLIGCDDDGGGSSFLSDTYCPAVCTKSVDCALDDNTQDECLNFCTHGWETTMREDYMTAYQECFTASTCENLPFAESDCRDSSAGFCTSNPTDAMVAYCTWLLECQNQAPPTPTEVNECIANDDYMSDYLACKTSSALVRFAACMEDGECYETQIDECDSGI